MLTEQDISELRALKSRYEKPQAILLPVLWRIQERNGWIDDAGMNLAAELAECTKAHVLGVVSFYTMFFEKPMGRHHIQVCTNVSCMLRGGNAVYEKVKDCLHIGHMERTPDGVFSLEEVECMGACGGAPMIAVGDTFFEKISADDAVSIIETIRTSGNVPAPKRFAQLPDLTREAI
ncbi:MAG: NADH-quinone oxidoreductase subunit NuoE [Bacteroidetes bacterium]|nr:NADH-quinone oxidoreductase subunit NuoE [Bacteroidota bacterium]